MKDLTTRLLLTLCILWCAPVGTYAADHEGRRGLAGLVYAVKEYIDSSAVKGIDPRYIGVPERPWQIVVRSNVAQTRLTMRSTVDAGSLFTDMQGALHWKPLIATEPSLSVGVWAGYRGYGIGYSRNVAGDRGGTLSVGATGGNYGVDIRIHRFHTDEPEVSYAGNTVEAGVLTPTAGTERWQLESAIRVHTLIAEGFYLFNGRRFSYSAAYDQSAIQLHSAGSLMIGAMYYYAHINYADHPNADFILFMDNIGHLRQWQASIGVGYAYNWVPARGWLISAMVMPLLTGYNRLKTTTYDSNYRQLALDSQTHEFYELPTSDYRLTPMGEDIRHSHLTLSYDARLSLTYQQPRWYVNAYAVYNNFRYSAASGRGRLTDWQACLQLGVRL